MGTTGDYGIMYFSISIFPSLVGPDHQCYSPPQKNPTLTPFSSAPWHTMKLPIKILEYTDTLASHFAYAFSSIPEKPPDPHPLTPIYRKNKIDTE